MSSVKIRMVRDLSRSNAVYADDARSDGRVVDAEAYAYASRCLFALSAGIAAPSAAMARRWAREERESASRSRDLGRHDHAIESEFAASVLMQVAGELDALDREAARFAAQG